MRRFSAVLILFLCGCTETLYAPAICADEAIDTVAIIDNSQYVTYHECERWRALSDSTKCWTNDGEWVHC